MTKSDLIRMLWTKEIYNSNAIALIVGCDISWVNKVLSKGNAVDESIIEWNDDIMRRKGIIDSIMELNGILDVKGADIYNYCSLLQALGSDEFFLIKFFSISHMQLGAMRSGDYRKFNSELIGIRLEEYKEIFKCA